MTKRILALLLVLCMVFALVACGGSDTKTDDKGSDTTKTDDTQKTDDAGKTDDTKPSGGAIEGAAGIGGEGEKEDEAEHVYTEITVGSLGAKFVGHFDATCGFSMDVSGSSMTLLYDRPFFINPSTGEWTSEILSFWEMGDDNVATLTIREGVTFNRNGEQLLAEDLLYSFQRSATSPLNAANWAKYTDLENCEISDDGLTLKVPFRVPFGAWYYQLSNMGIIDKSWIAENGGEENFDWFDPELANGTGPYVPTEFTIGVSTTYEKIENWWGAEDYYSSAYCYADKITCLQYTDETTMMVDYENNNLDLVLSLSSTSMERVMNDPSLGTAQSVSSNSVAMLVMNYDENGNPDLEDENLRKAICYGTPANDLSELAYGVLYSPAQSVIPATSQYSVAGYTYDYDPDLAKSYMDECSVENPTFTWVVNSGSAAAEIAEAFNAYMAQLGITVNVEVYDILTCISMWETEGATDFQIVNNNNANASGDPYVLMQYLGDAQSFYCANRTGAEINDLINSSIYTFDTSVRAEKYAELQEYIYNDYSVIPLCEWNVGLAFHGNIKSTRINDVYQANLRYLEF